MRYLPLSDAERRQMLQVIGAPSVEALFRDVPERARRPGPFDLPKALGEIEVERALAAPVAMGYVASSAAHPATALELVVRGTPRPARVAPLPFVPHRYYRG